MKIYYHTKIGKEFISFGDVAVEKHKFHQNKNPIAIEK